MHPDTFAPIMYTMSCDDDDANQPWERKALEHLIREGEGLNHGRGWAYKYDKPDDGGKTTCSGTFRNPHEEIGHDSHGTCPACKLQAQLDDATQEHETVEGALQEEIEDLEGSVVLLEKENKELSNENFDLLNRIKEWGTPAEDAPNIGRKIRA